MDFIHKLLIVFFVVSLVVTVICYDIHRRRVVPVESFQDFQTTIITNFTPKEGDSSTIVTIEGRGLEYIQEVLFKDIECVILENRNPQKIQVIPPALTEVGFTIEQIRKTIDETGSGEPVEVKLLKKEWLNSGYKINRTKRKRMVNCTAIFMDRYKIKNAFYQFDLITIVGNQIKHIENIFSL